jgi:hypothetical protein
MASMSSLNRIKTSEASRLVQPLYQAVCLKPCMSAVTILSSDFVANWRPPTKHREVRES